MTRNCAFCGSLFDDADQSTVCPHPLIMPVADLAQKKRAIELMSRDICFAHQPAGPTHRIQSVGWNGMVTLHDMPGEFAPHLFVIKGGDT